jgi:hypothetical protein
MRLRVDAARSGLGESVSLFDLCLCVLVFLLHCGQASLVEFGCIPAARSHSRAYFKTNRQRHSSNRTCPPAAASHPHTSCTALHLSDPRVRACVWQRTSPVHASTAAHVSVPFVHSLSAYKSRQQISIPTKAMVSFARARWCILVDEY